MAVSAGFYGHKTWVMGESDKVRIKVLKWKSWDMLMGWSH